MFKSKTYQGNGNQHLSECFRFEHLHGLPMHFLLFYPFTDPITIPFTKYLCKKGQAATIGRVDRKICAHFTVLSETSAMVCQSVVLFTEVSPCMIIVCRQPVSYTHLDVYKRQSNSWQRLPPFSSPNKATLIKFPSSSFSEQVIAATDALCHPYCQGSP